MKGGTLTGTSGLRVCDGCGFAEPESFYQASGPWGEVDYCTSCALARYPDIENAERVQFSDHLDDRLKAAIEKESEQNHKLMVEAGLACAHVLPPCLAYCVCKCSKCYYFKRLRV